jgi:hypothetical protein
VTFRFKGTRHGKMAQGIWWPSLGRLVVPIGIRSGLFKFQSRWQCAAQHYLEHTLTYWHWPLSQLFEALPRVLRQSCEGLRKNVFFSPTNTYGGAEGRGCIAPAHARPQHQMVWVVSVTPRSLFTPGGRTPGNHWTGGWVGPRAGLDTEVRGKILLSLPGIKPRSPGRPVVVRHYTAWATPAPKHAFL